MDLDRRLGIGRLPEELFLNPIVSGSDRDNDILGQDYDDDDDDAADRTPKEQASRTSNTSEFPSVSQGVSTLPFIDTFLLTIHLHWKPDIRRPDIRINHL